MSARARWISNHGLAKSQAAALGNRQFRRACHADEKYAGARRAGWSLPHPQLPEDAGSELVSTLRGGPPSACVYPWYGASHRLIFRHVTPARVPKSVFEFAYANAFIRRGFGRSQKLSVRRLCASGASALTYANVLTDSSLTHWLKEL